MGDFYGIIFAGFRVLFPPSLTYPLFPRPVFSNNTFAATKPSPHIPWRKPKEKWSNIWDKTPTFPFRLKIIG